MFTIGILQPAYIPWLGFFEQLIKTEAFIIYDDVQFDKHGWRNRNRIKGPNGVQWLTIPVFTKGGPHKINETRINNNTPWIHKHLQSLSTCYKKAKYFFQYFGEIEDILASNEWEFLAELDIAIIKLICRWLEIKTPLYRSSSLNISGNRIERLINICKLFNATRFYEGESGKNYIDVEKFSKENINVTFQHYQHPVYPQLFGPFESHLSVLDLVFNCGPQSKETIIRHSGNKKALTERQNAEER